MAKKDPMKTNRPFTKEEESKLFMTENPNQRKEQPPNINSNIVSEPQD